MNENTQTRNTGNHMNNSQIIMLKRLTDMDAKAILETYPEIFKGITENNIHDHVKTWKRYPEDATAEEHKMHYNDSKSGRTSKAEAPDLSTFEDRLKRVEEKLDAILEILEKLN